MSSAQVFDRAQLQALCRALADSTGGLTHPEVTQLLTQYHLAGDPPPTPKWQRLFNAFAHHQNTVQTNRVILQIVADAANPVRFIGRRDEYEPFRENLNRLLAFLGLAVADNGLVISVARARTLPEAEGRARELRRDLVARGVHQDVLRFCRAELVADDYFHAVLEATKSVSQKMRDRTGLTDDGSVLIDHVFGGATPILIVNAFTTSSEKSEQSGFCNLLKGVTGMFRNPTAHAPRVLWAMSKEDAEDLLSLVSLIHRRIDGATMRPRV